MKIRSMIYCRNNNTLLKAFALIAVLIIGGYEVAFCAGKNNAKKAANNIETPKAVDIYELSLEDNLYTPEIERNGDIISTFQLNQARELKKKGYNVELMRNGEVIVISILSGQLFAPNDTVLNDLGRLTLKPLLKFLSKADMYKMILVMHTDNTGSESYTKNLSQSRVDAVFSWIESCSMADYVVPYALGAEEPLFPNNSIENRKMNRRLEIYLVPGILMIKQAQNGKIDFK